MILVQQTIMHDPENGQYGNCMQACVASLLELPLDAVPHFLDGDADGINPRWWDRFVEFLDGFGLYPADKEAGNGAPCWDHLASGVSPRGTHHQVIRNGFDLVHDPHPDGGGVEVDRITELIVVDPLKLHHLEVWRQHAAVDATHQRMPMEAPNP